MAAYAALISLMKVIDDIETHPSPPIFLDKQQVESLTEKLIFLQEFLESYNSPYAYSDEADPLEMRIVDAAQATEDVIESYIIDTIQLSAAAAAAASEDGGDEQISCIHFYEDVQNVIEELDLLKKEVAGIKREKVVHQRNMGSDDGGLRSRSSTENNPIMVGFDDVLLQLLDRLTDGNTNRQIIPIVGMGGIGKTTLAKDCEIRSSTIVELWVSEGFLKPIDNKSLTTIAKEYLKELVDRNLIVVQKVGLYGNVKFCKIHDLLRDLSMKEAQKQRFFYVLREQSPQGVISQHRIVNPGSTSKEKICDALDSMSHARSYVCRTLEFQELPNSRFLRTTLNAHDSPYALCRCSSEHVFHLVNTRYLAFEIDLKYVIPSINLLWNLHTLIIRCWDDFIAPIEIWKMHKLRHVNFPHWKLHLPDPVSIDNDIIIMENLEVLKGLEYFSLSEDVKRIPNIKKLKLKNNPELLERVNYLSYLQCLSKLESLDLRVSFHCNGKFQLKMSFPPSLTKLFLLLPLDFELEDILPAIGSLPLLQKLGLKHGRFRTGKWGTIEDQFPSLKSLTLTNCNGLENWTVLESFPHLQELHLEKFNKLKEIPSEIGEIPTLKSIRLRYCSESAVLSAKQILEEQEDLQGDQADLHVDVRVSAEDEALKKLASPNFEVTSDDAILKRMLRVREQHLQRSQQTTELPESEKPPTGNPAQRE
ncbi:putative late blight resistance protein homolog R1A-3 isoform X2 [Salvia splendens]|uniref:putative late blight resistance protein homolog R1A-3 isoform X2 n=1 Tax=Salvia splendens TaxID=180675 RepID=UPI001C270766|nr:putative late blight resistance protein homolog R1A-3 isoform X2 [Salvia splendens]